MLNISPTRVNDQIDFTKYPSLHRTEQLKSGRVLIRLLVMFFVIFLIAMILPWTQNIRAKGTVTTLRPDQRPQTIQSAIDGRVESWYVREGDFVEAGDTIMRISEVKDDYFDPDLLERIDQQIQSQTMAADAYGKKSGALAVQIAALEQTSKLKYRQAIQKLEQARLQVTSDSIDLIAAKINEEIAQKQFERIDQLWKDGLKSRTEMENRELVQQQMQARRVASANKLQSSRNQVAIAEVELEAITAEYSDAIAKASSDRFAAESQRFGTEAGVTKLQNAYASFAVRSAMYFITAPQAGYITQTITTGIGETIKAGEEIASIMPAQYDLAVQLYVDPIDLPLLEKGQTIRIQFDGWPAIVFSGWPNTSHGTYGGKIFAIDNFISPNGKYRILVSPDPDDYPWPDALRVGAGTDNIILLKNVQIWYELWRQLNGFPPDYYKPISEPPNAN